MFPTSTNVTSLTEKCARCTLFLSYVLLWVACICLLYVGPRAVSLSNTYGQISGETQLRVAGIAFICTGLLILVVCAMGPLAWRKRSRLLLVLICSLLVVVLFCEIGTVLLSVFHWSGVESNLSKLFKAEMDAYTDDTSAAADIDRIQTKLQCCGAGNYSDWNVTKFFIDNPGQYPQSCYSVTELLSSSEMDKGLTGVERFNKTHAVVGPFAQGCTTLLAESFHFWYSIIIASGLVFLLIQILGSHSTCIVFCHSSPSVPQTWADEQYARL